MRTSLVLSILGISLLLCPGCDNSMEPAAKPVVYAILDQPFTLEPGQTASLTAERLSVTFERVLEDGRCPADTFCLVEGHATMAVRARQDDGPALLLSVVFPAPADGVAYGGFRIHAEALLPLRPSTGTIPAADYRLTLRIDRP